MPADREALHRRQQAKAENRKGADGGDEPWLPTARALQRRTAGQREPQHEQIEDCLADDGEKLRRAQRIETARRAIENRHETDDRAEQKKKTNRGDTKLRRGFAQLLALRERTKATAARVLEGGCRGHRKSSALRLWRKAGLSPCAGALILPQQRGRIVGDHAASGASQIVLRKAAASHADRLQSGLGGGLRVVR